MKKVYRAEVERWGPWWVGKVPEVPGAISQARTLKELRENLKEAITLILEEREKLGAKVKAIQIRR